MKFLPLLVAASLVAGCSGHAPDMVVSDAWARATAPGQSSAAIYATIANGGSEDRLVAVDSAAGTAMLHRSDHHGGVARMRMIEALDIPAGAQVRLSPGGAHVMMTGLSAPLTAGTRMPVTFRFAKAAPRTVDVAVVAAGSR